ncbi:MAG TPA: hypothetical protein VLD61_01605, partial [Methylomirabilota bacterium]|nr:hypothetical protein [Methylomirabilota bacterium]
VAEADGAGLPVLDPLQAEGGRLAVQAEHGAHASTGTPGGIVGPVKITGIETFVVDAGWRR